jgi:hypothetical protein
LALWGCLGRWGVGTSHFYTIVGAHILHATTLLQASSLAKMMTFKVCGAVVMLCAVVAGTPSLDTDGTNIKLNAPGGDVMVSH